MPNRLTPLYSKIYYKEENYLKVRTIVFKYTSGKNLPAFSQYSAAYSAKCAFCAL
jgi:hypothetical protein